MTDIPEEYEDPFEEQFEGPGCFVETNLAIEFLLLIASVIILVGIPLSFLFVIMESK